MVVSRVASRSFLAAGAADKARQANDDASDFSAEIRAAGAVALMPSPSLCELFAVHPRDAGWAGFLLARQRPQGPVLWVQERMAIIEAGRIHPPGLGLGELIHVEARDSRSVLWAMEEGLRCAALSLVVGELWGDPAALDFTATRRLAVAAERDGVPCWLVRLGGSANLSGARQRWRLDSAPSLANPFDPKAPGAPGWQAELFRSRFGPPGQWRLVDEAHRPADPGHRVGQSGNGALVAVPGRARFPA